MTSLIEAYKSAFALYEAGKFREAACVFTDLCSHAPYEYAFWKGLASSLLMEENFEPSLSAWGVCAILNEKDPYPHFHAAECLISIKQFADAIKALDKAYERALEMKDEKLLGKIETLKQMYS